MKLEELLKTEFTNYVLIFDEERKTVYDLNMQKKTYNKIKSYNVTNICINGNCIQLTVNKGEK